MTPSLVKHCGFLASGAPALVISQIVVRSVAAALVLVRRPNWSSILLLSCLSTVFYNVPLLKATCPPFVTCVLPPVSLIRPQLSSLRIGYSSQFFGDLVVGYLTKYYAVIYLRVFVMPIPHIICGLHTLIGRNIHYR